MKRRDFIALGAVSIVGSGTGLAPAAWAQQPGGRKRVGFLTSGAPNPDGSVPTVTARNIDALRAGLNDEGFIDGANVSLDVRLNVNDTGVMRAAARDFASGGYDVLVGYGTPNTAALVAETRTIPIVFASISDPIGSGFVENFARPGGNVTGFTNLEASLAGKWLEMLRELAPGVRRAVLMSNPDFGVGNKFFLPSFRAAAGALGIEPVAVDVRTLAEIEAAIAAMGKVPGTGLVMPPDTYTAGTYRFAVVDAVARENLPAIYSVLSVVEAGGLIGYFSDQPDICRRAGGYAGLILKGARPADLPVQAPTKYLLGVNLKTAKAQGITVPPSILVLADEVIQ